MPGSLAAAALGVCVLAAPAARAVQFSVIANIPGGPQIGAVRGSVLYGTVPHNGDGVLFSLTMKGAYTPLHVFRAATDGSAPDGQLVLEGSTILGTAAGGGANYDGTIWQYSPKTGFTVPHSFGGTDDGTVPMQGPAHLPGGGVAGSTSQGAINGSGNIFELTPKGAYKVLYKFQSGNDGHCPFSGVAVGADGTIYGTTVGMGFGGNPTGSVWKFTKSGGLQTLYVFADGADGEWPEQAPVVDAAGNIYGTTSTQNGKAFAGAVWKISASGKFSVLHDLNGATDGFQPNSPLLLDTDGNLYGTTSSGGANGYGTVFQITPAGAFTVMHTFAAGADGAQPTGNLVHTPSGAIYGGTAWGPVFKIVP